MKTTELENQVLIRIAKSEYIDVSSIDELVDFPTWSFVATNETKELAGALGSLAKKGLVGCDNEKGDRGQNQECCWLTKEGVQVLKEIGFTY